jgi:two-component system NtrC family sensor kinase
MAPSDLNEAIQSTLIVGRNEYKYLADLETDLGPLPPIMSHIGEINQVLLNLIVNAAHAIQDVTAGSTNRGLIRLTTRLENADTVVITVTDSGSGIPLAVRERIFDPFFTTKAVGRGTGQGLAIARSVIDGHGGTLTFETEMGKGTTFFVRLPVNGAPSATEASA